MVFLINTVYLGVYLGVCWIKELSRVLQLCARTSAWHSPNLLTSGVACRI